MGFNRRVRSLLALGIVTEIHLVLGHFSIPGNAAADLEADFPTDTSESRLIERPDTSASNWARQISEGRATAKAEWEADKYSKHFSYRLKGKVATK
jgi:hypothetical protein